ncbi:cellulose binding domain-containing protein [Micromonospora sp. MS34]|uniref:cellulose binding domain-containing protein n=1 Tax=Micromonospora sp. MS34 TaxID=3385971 RepID=UPI0039A23027
MRIPTAAAHPARPPRPLRPGRRRWTAYAASLLLATGTLAGLPPADAGAAVEPVTVTVNARAGLATVPDTALGVNHAIWDANLGTAETSDLLRAAGVRMLRYPGGSYGDIYHWRTHTAPGGYVAPGTGFDAFMAAARRVGAEPMIIANYGTGTPAEAADWVRYANVTKGYGAKYWTVGNENYGNGLYGSAWEADDHPDKSATRYAELVVEYAEAMKAVDPTVQVGAVLTMPANWPDGLTAGDDPGPWNQTVLTLAGPKIDFVDVHWYPGGGDPFAPYHGLSMMNLFAGAGGQFVRAGTNRSLVTAHAVRRGNGDVAVLLVNKDPENDHPVTIDYAGFSPSGSAPTVYRHTNGAAAITQSRSGSATGLTLLAYSLTILVVPSADPAGGRPGAPGRPTAGAVTDRTATISWPAATPGAAPIAKYEVYRQHGAVSEQLGETTGTSLTVGNLNPGSRYTINVLTRDTAGNVSWSSPPLAFATGSPAASTCGVRFSKGTDWGNGYLATVDIVNNGPNPINGWTLTWTWPTGWQQVSSGWSANWSQAGSAVKATSTADNRRLAAGASTGVGFVGGYSGPNVPPTVFTLNGTVCGTL